MKLIEQIKADQLSARKTYCAEEAILLTTLIGESEMVGKNANREVTDDEVIAVIKKFIKNIDFTMTVDINAAAKDKCLSGKQILEKYLPAMLSESELRDNINGIFALRSGNMGLIMKDLKQNFSGKYDANLASTIIKSMV